MILHVVNGGFVNVVSVTPGLNLRPEAARVVRFICVRARDGSVGTKDGDGAISRTERQVSEYP